MRVPLTVSHPHENESVTVVDAEVDPSLPFITLPASIVERLRLPTVGPDHHYARLQVGEAVSVTSVTVADDHHDAVVGLASLTGLCLEVDRRTGRLRRFKPRL